MQGREIQAFKSTEFILLISQNSDWANVNVS